MKLSSWVLFVFLFACAVTAASGAGARNDAPALHYSDLYEAQQEVADLQDLKRLHVELQIASTDPAVLPGNIKLTIHLASGQTTDIPVDSSGHYQLPVSDALKAEDPVIVSNQPAETLNAKVIIDLVPLDAQQMSYADLLQGVQQYNTALDREPAIAAMYKSKAAGLLLFFNYGKHTLTIHDTAKGHVVKSEAARPGKGHLKGLHIGQLLETTTLIYVKLDPKLLKSNPKVSLDGMPNETLPAI